MRTFYANELESVRHNLIRMGDTTVSLLTEAIRMVVDTDPAAAARASELEAQTDHQHRLIHDQCLSLITLQAPVARDARLVTGILDAIVDLELIGDYAYEIVTLSASMKGRPPSQLVSQLSEVAGKIRELLSMAVDGWRSDDGTPALSVRPREAAIRAECEFQYEKLSKLIAGPGNGTPYVNPLIICKHLERILRHAVSVAEQAVGAAPVRQAG